LTAAGQTDRFELPVTPGQVLQFELYAARVGAPVDGLLSLHDVAGNQLAASDDRPGTLDPGLEFTVPPGMQALLVAVRDTRGAASPDAGYRLAVRPAQLPDFALVLEGDRLLVPAGSVGLLRVRARRAGYLGPIALDMTGLPEGVEIAPREIPAGAGEALLGVRAAGSVAAAVVGIRGMASAPAIERWAEFDGGPSTQRALWLARHLAIATTPSPPLQLAWNSGSEGDQLMPLGAMPVSVRVIRSGSARGPVRLSLVTSQPMPKKTVKVNNQDQVVDDVDRALRLEGAPVVPPDQELGTAQLLVPGDLPVLAYDLALRGELLAADGQSVVATATTPVRRLATAAPPPQPALAVFEDQADFVTRLDQGGGQATLHEAEKHSGRASVKVTPDQRYNPNLPGLGIKVRQHPGPGEFRYLRFAWKKQGGQAICLQLNHDGAWGPAPGSPAKFRYHAGPGPECYGASLQVDANLPAGFVVVTRDLFADFGEFTLQGLALSPVDGEYALFDHIYLGRTAADLDAVRP
jgi:hypothetical protein